MTPPGRLLRAAVSLMLLAASAAAAHALLERTEPRAGSTLRTPPREVRLWFTEALEAAWSRAEVVAADGRRVEAGPARLDASAPRLLRLPLAPLPPGVYTVRFRVVSVDSHVSEGRFTFRVAP